MSNSTQAGQYVERLERAKTYWRSPAGKALWEAQRACLGPYIEETRGEHGLEMALGASPLSLSPLRHKIHWVPRPAYAASPFALVCPAEAWALPDRCLDTVILHHWLEELSAPRDTLEEAARTCADHGRLVIVGFNPLGLLAPLRRWSRQRAHYPFSGNWLSVACLKKWLAFVDFEIERVDYCGFRRPGTSVIHPQWETLGRRYNFALGECYVIQAKRQRETAQIKRLRFKLDAPNGPRSSLGVTRSGSSSGSCRTDLHRTGSPRADANSK